MTAPTPVGFLDFFILEASDYVEQLDTLLDTGGASGPDPDGLQRVARALRGSATMARLLAFAEVAAGLERVGRALREGALRWEAGLSGVVVAAVDDCKLLLRHARTWSDADDARARARVSELTQLAPVRGPAEHASASTHEQNNYLATESSNVGAGLELLATRPSDRSAAANVMRRVRALRGIASVKDHPALADVLEAAERAARPLELGEPSLSSERVALLAAAATVLRGVASSIRGGAFDAPAADIARFAEALDALQEREIGVERVVPIAELFFDDGGATIVDAATNPPTTPAERFRLEAVSLGEHLQRLVSDARAARDDVARERVRRELRQALRSLRQAAESFGEKHVADLVASRESAVVQLDAVALESLDEVATLLITPPSEAPEERVLPRATAMTTAMETAGGERAATPISRLGLLLDAGIEKLGSLRNTPFSVPSAIADQPPVPIEVLLYRGRAAIERCVQIRGEVRGSGGTLDSDSLDEIFDLLDLALTD
jgi:chemotaxis protein histidine kinase CheA